MQLYVRALAPPSLNHYLGSLGDEFASRSECIDPGQRDDVCAAVAAAVAAAAATATEAIPPHELLLTIERWYSELRLDFDR